MNPATTVTFRRVGACPRLGYGGVAISGFAALVPSSLGTTLVMGRRGDNVPLMYWTSTLALQRKEARI